MTINCWDTPYSSANGQLLIGSTGTTPSWATLTQGTNTTITNDAGSITVAFGAASGDFELISSATASASAEITFTNLSSTYDSYVIFMQGVQPSTDNVILYMQTSTDNGATYDSSASDYSWSSHGTSDGGTTDSEGSTADTKMSIAGDQASEELGNVGNEKLDMVLWIYRPSSTNYTKIQFDGTYLDDANDESTVHGGGVRLSAADVDAVRLYMSTGNVGSGIFKLYGYKS